MHVLSPRDGTPTGPTVPEGHLALSSRALLGSRSLAGEDALVDVFLALPSLDLLAGLLRPPAGQGGHGLVLPLEGLPEGVGDPLGPRCHRLPPLAH